MVVEVLNLKIYARLTCYIIIFYDVIPFYFPDNVTFCESYQSENKTIFKDTNFLLFVELHFCFSTDLIFLSHLYSFLQQYLTDY